MKTKTIKKEYLIKEVEKLKKQRFISVTVIEEGENLTILYQFDDRGGVINLKVEIPKARPIIESIIDIIPGANIYECEAHDLFGVEFLGNPNLRHHHFLADDFKGEPPLLRKEGDARS